MPSPFVNARALRAGGEPREPRASRAWWLSGLCDGSDMRWPLQALAVAEMRPQGPTGRVGAGLVAGSPPR
jgi:hypothetical protein